MRETIPEDLRHDYELYRRVVNKDKDAHVTFGYVQGHIERIAKAEARNKVLEEALREITGLVEAQIDIATASGEDAPTLDRQVAAQARAALREDR